MIADAFTHWQPQLVRYALQLLQNGHDAEEVVQDVFTRLVATPGRYSLGEHAEVLLFRMVRNGCIDARRKRRPRTNRDVEGHVADPAPGRDDELERALARLPADEREALLLTALDGLGYREVAQILGCSVGTVAARRCAAVDKLRARLHR